MKRFLLYPIIAAVLSVAPVFAQSITPQIGGGISQGFDGGISGNIASTFGFSNFTGSNLSHFVAAQAAIDAGTRNGLVVAVGDSTTAGQGSTGSGATGNPLSNGYPAQLAALKGWDPNSSMSGNNNSPVTSALSSFDARWGTAQATWTFGGRSTIAGAEMMGVGTGTLSFTPTEQIDTIQVQWAGFPGAGTFNVNFDGGTNTVINTNTATSLGFTTLSTTLGTHTINFSLNTGAATSTFLNGIVAYNSAVKHFNIYNAGWTTATSANFNSGSEGYSPLGKITALAADLNIYMIGINDWDGAVAIPTFTTNVQAFITAMKAGGGDCIIMSPVPSNPSGSNPPAYAVQATYVAALKSVALSNNCPFIDLWNLFGGTYQVSLMFDQVHPNGAGYGVIANYVKTGLAPGFVSH